MLYEIYAQHFLHFVFSFKQFRDDVEQNYDNDWTYKCEYKHSKMEAKNVENY